MGQENNGKRNKKANKKAAEEKAERALEDELFGDPAGFSFPGLEDDIDENEADETSGRMELEEPNTLLKRAWLDEDDENIEVNIADRSRLRKLRVDDDEHNISGSEYIQRLRKQFLRLHPTPDWAELPSVRRARKRRERELRLRAGDRGKVDEEVEFSDSDLEMDEAEMALLTNPDSLLDRDRQRHGAQLARLPSDEIQVKRARDANAQQTSNATILGLAFHPEVPLLLTAGLDKSLRLFSIDGVNNHLVQSVFFEDMPIYNAEYSCDGREIILAGRRKYFYSYDLYKGKVDKIPYIMGRTEKSLESFAVAQASINNEGLIAFMGKDGNTILISQRTKQWVSTLKMNGTVRGASFSNDGQVLSTFGDEGEVYFWDLRTMQCLNRMEDQGCVKGTTVAMSNTGNFVAAGSDSGVVNFYRQHDATSRAKASPIKAIMNLTTDVHRIKFNHDDQLAAITSKEKKDQLRLVHLPSMRVFSNWPTSQTPLSYVSNVAFSAFSGMMAIGNDKGKVLLYRLRHFPSI